MGISRCERVERLRGKGVEQRIDGIGIGGLESVVRLKAQPGGISLVDVVVEAECLYLFVVIAGVRNTSPVRATVSIRWAARCQSAIRIERTPEHRQRRTAGV